ncbi:hypothetical protein RJ640_017844 [Escallonia rubra]|uniref:FBD domain-containing protein n=1 Tax=Escallonia rubra TaxID=112253 RepID=A0AA88UJ92_9ASTE|nr:hypothetical protein RJ640_017844 [Escallonia rubra]
MEERNNFAPAEEKNMEAAIFLTYRGNEECKKNVWYLDTGASNHMCGRKELFTDLDETIKGEVTFGDSSKIPVTCKAKLMINLKNRDRKFISDVYYVPALKSNIISLGQLLEKGYDIHMKDGALVIRNKDRELIAKVEMTKNRLFTLDIRSEMMRCMKSVIKDDSWLWHLRFGHLGFSGLKLLSRTKMYLARGGVPRRLPAAFDYLKDITLADIAICNELDEVTSVLCIIRSSPHLQNLVISKSDHHTNAAIYAQVCHSVEDIVVEPALSLWEEDCTLSQLRTVKYKSMRGLRAELNLIKFLLACSPSLEKMSIKRKEVADVNTGILSGFRVLKRLTKFHRASPKAEITFSDPSEAKFSGR